MPHLHLVTSGPPQNLLETASFLCLQAAHHFLPSFNTGGRILVAVSGGSDSRGLLLALDEALRSGRYPHLSLSCCTVDHGLRPQSADEAQDVAAFCKARAIAHETLRWEGDKPATGLQAAARMARYRLLAQAAVRSGALCVVTGHTRDDQHETIVMRGRRSPNDAPGLSGMAPAVLFERRMWVLRPFLTVPRADIRTFLTARGEGWIDDPSNLDPRFERVRTRLEGSVTVAGDLSTDAANARSRSAAQAADLLSRYVKAFPPFACRVDPALVTLLDTSDTSDARRALLSLAAVIGGRAFPLGRESAERVLNFLREQRHGRLTAGRVVFDRRSSGLFLYREARDLPVSILGGGDTTIWDGRFHLHNTGGTALRISAGADRTDSVREAVTAGLPEAIAKRAVKAVFHADGADVSALTATPYLALYDTFLPYFDRSLADMLAALFGRDPYAVLPVDDVFTEKTGCS